ncbi:MAG TPA: helix-turn-helix transcriptional regulator [Streptosporangiaceae bacterium]|jgi:DNA-binding CsgD family transcriptional regulator|nr:helix-turn-helix transcriptional regulator [Streptosporangiaceae bacterium]
MTRRPSMPYPRPLTARELAIAGLLAEGLSTETIAGKLFLSPHTVAAHLAKMLRNLNARNRTELVARLYVHGILVSGEWPPRANPVHNLAVSQPLRSESRPAESVPEPQLPEASGDFSQPVAVALSRSAAEARVRRI